MPGLNADAPLSKPPSLLPAATEAVPSAEAEMRTAQMQEDCYHGVDEACQQLTYEEEGEREGVGESLSIKSRHA